MFLFFAPSVLLSKPQKQKQNEGDEKDEIKECNRMKMLKEIRRRLQLAERGGWNRLLSSHTEDCPRSAKKARKEEDTVEGITASTRPTERDYIRGACQAQVRRGLAPNSQESVEKVERMVAMGPKERGKPNETQSTRNDHSQEIQEKKIRNTFLEKTENDLVP